MRSKRRMALGGLNPSIFSALGNMSNLIVDEDGNPDYGAATAGMAMNGVGMGAKIGSMIAPGIGTVVGGALGGIGGGIYGSITERKQREKMNKVLGIGRQDM